MAPRERPTLDRQPHARPTEARPTPRLEVVVPVHNEERALRASVERLCRRLDEDIPVPFRVTIVDNASTDRTADIARSLERDVACVRYLHLDEPGRGRALRAAWSASDADVVAYMDVDLSTDLVHLPALIAPLLAGRADLAIGSRLAPGAQVTRGLKRELISRCYNALLGVVLGAGFSDAQCGFKAGRRDAIRALLPSVESEGWFFDTELLYLAQRNAFSIHEVPVRWVDDPDSRVRIVRTIVEDLKGIARLHRRTREGGDRIGVAAVPACPRSGDGARRFSRSAASVGPAGEVWAERRGRRGRAIRTRLRTCAGWRRTTGATAIVPRAMAARYAWYGRRDAPSPPRDRGALRHRGAGLRIVHGQAGAPLGVADDRRAKLRIRRQFGVISCLAEQGDEAPTLVGRDGEPDVAAEHVLVAAARPGVIGGTAHDLAPPRRRVAPMLLGDNAAEHRAQQVVTLDQVVEDVEPTLERHTFAAPRIDRRRRRRAGIHDHTIVS